MATNTEIGRTFLASVLAALPEAQRAQAQAVFEAAEAAQALDLLGQGVKRQDDYSRGMDAARATLQAAQAAQAAADAELARVNAVASQQTQWWETNKAALEEYTVLKAGSGPTPTPTPGPTPGPTPTPPAAPGAVTVDDLMALRNEGYQLMMQTPQLALKHFKTFGEELDLEGLAREAVANRQTLLQAYDAKFKTRYDELAATAEAARVKQIEEAAVQKYLQAHPQMPYPSPTQAGSTLDGLNAEDPNQYSPAAAAAEYTRLVAARGGAPA